MNQSRTAQPAKLNAQRCHLLVESYRDPAAVEGEIETRVCFCILPAAIGQLRNKMRLMPRLGPPSDLRPQASDFCSPTSDL